MAGRRAERAKMEEALRREMDEKYARAPSSEDSDKKTALSVSGLVAGVSSLWPCARGVDWAARVRLHAWRCSATPLVAFLFVERSGPLLIT